LGWVGSWVWVCLWVDGLLTGYVGGFVWVGLGGVKPYTTEPHIKVRRPLCFDKHTELGKLKASVC